MKKFNTLEKCQQYFNTDIEELMSTSEDDIKFLEQNHFGDLLIEKTEQDNERMKLWRNLDCNVSEGENLIDIEYSGKKNNWVWETVFSINR